MIWKLRINGKRYINVNSGIILPKLVATVHPSGFTTFKFYSWFWGSQAEKPRFPLQHCVAEAAFALLRLPYCVRHRNSYKVPQVKTGNGFALSQ